MPHDHSHGTEEVSDKVLLWAVIINVGLSIFEFLAGAISGSVSLMADALHNTNDAAALLVAWIARKISKRGADRKFTFGYQRAELIGAMIQLTALILVGLFLVYESIKRFVDPQPLLGGWIMAAAGVALVVDVATTWLLWAMSKGSLNVKAAFLHNITDAFASLAVLAGGAAIFFLGWYWVDPALSLLIAGYILFMSFGLLKRTAGILMEGTPPQISVDSIVAAICEIDGVSSMHHLHVWQLDEHHRALEVHIVLQEAASLSDMENVRDRVKATLQERFDIAHSTLEFESKERACGESDPHHGH